MPKEISIYFFFETQVLLDVIVLDCNFYLFALKNYFPHKSLYLFFSFSFEKNQKNKIKSK